ncbi:MAG: helix-turn-helix domain-containing protein [Firmicutes bacterium]|nr:helix-turn-helix domain-containing protein [Bacillota bacterium]
MAIFRVEKTKDFTLMSNHHLRNKELSLKAKGLLSLMLSLPDTWDYTLKGLASICSEGIDAIRTAVKELEQHGYIVRKQLRGENGRIKDMEYIIYERPQKNEPESAKPRADSPELEHPILDNPILDMPILEEPMLEETTQLNTKESNTKELKTKSIHLSIHQKQEAAECPDLAASCQRESSAAIQKRIEYDLLAQEYDPRALQDLVQIMEEVECACQYNEQIRIGEAAFPADLVAKRFHALNSIHVRYVMDCMKLLKNRIRNIKAYITMALFNAPATIQQYYDSEVRHDFG